ncbi:MAG: PIN domain-containing protein [Bacteroidota bacterium]
MIHSVQFTCVLDTNVIYPIELRDILLWFAHYDLYTPKWSKGIFTEWISVMKQKGVSDLEVEKRTNWLLEAFPDAMVEHYEFLIDSLELPDPDDRHVLAAAIKTNANLIVTNNLKDFPYEALEPHGILAKSADDFLTDIIDIDCKRAVDVFKELVLNRRNPVMDEYAVLERFRKNGLEDTANYLHACL